MITNWLTYRACAASLDAALREAVIVDAFTQEKNELVIGLVRDGEPLWLQVSVGARAPFLHLRREHARARRNTVSLFDGLAGAVVRSADIARGDRIIRLVLADGRALLLVFYGPRSNVALVDASGGTISQFKAGIPLPRTPDAFVLDADAPSIDDVAERRTVAEATGADATAAAMLASLKPWLTGVFAAEILHRAGIDGAARAAELDDAGIVRLHRAMTGAIAEAQRGHAYVYPGQDAPDVLSLVALTHFGDRKSEYFSDIQDALSLYLRRRFTGESFNSHRAGILLRIARASDALTRSLERARPPEELERRAAECEKHGNLLMIHLNDLPEQPGRITVPDLFEDPRLVVTIPLDERLSLLENAQRLFAKARTLRASVDHVVARTTLLQERLAALQSLRLRCETATSTKDLRAALADHPRIMDMIGLNPKGEPEDRPFPFRRFVVTGGFEVWAGRNSANNDELTVRHAKPNDLWFHARGVGGSHVVLRVGSGRQVPKEAIRDAASIAAYYSKHRNARSVLVAYTEKKYVRKPRGVPAGTVYLEREKVIMAEPRLPDSADAADRDAAPVPPRGGRGKTDRE